ncbi:uncharacterized protein LOC111259505 [Varroa jacobsoni]|uniref:uncharacterized protein LOC111259505 n=1 Tax=Varroa jacobsoni TaxID=62625 RepID=UPI000BF94AC2|nr:uncharacterized protein LOC111259505 [Varroa jacobsoni]
MYQSTEQNNGDDRNPKASPLRYDFATQSSATITAALQRPERNPESLCRCVPCGQCFYTSKEATDHFESIQHLREMQTRQVIVASQPSAAIKRFMRRESRVVRPLTAEEKLVHSKLLEPLLVCGDGEKFGDFILKHGLFTPAEANTT